ncbi:hypothetical protein [Paenibacillus xylanilyticus]|uniref:hypothetical protein n=1 Tax=Paenibacillus xylanilyticus TaxID=248903 RepID=UPI00129DA8FE|nr:hypothetical protein [Paenibacillus xylanilyticus]
MSSGWSEFRVIPYEYNDQVRQIDEQLLRLVAQRKQITGAVQYHPPQEVIDEWTASLDLKEEDIRYVLRSVQPMPQRHFFPPEELPLIGVVPIMKRTVQDSCEYLITHSMQYETESIIHVEIHYKGNETDRVHVVPHLALEVISEQNHMSTRHSSRGGGGETHLSYRVVPALPSSLEQVQFSLVPSIPELEHKMEEVILDKQVDFE